MKHTIEINKNLENPIKIIYTSDVHANSTHFENFLDIASKEDIKYVIINGDICPKNIFMEFSNLNIILRKQEAYLKEKLIIQLKKFKQQNPEKIVFMDLSNDDFKFNRYILERQENYLLNLLHMRIYEILPNINIVGYMAVPITPFGLKDWEKPDKKGYYDSHSRLQGCRSINGAVKDDYTININSEDTIENDLKILSEQITNPSIFIAHSPPVNTKLDMIRYSHVGSSAVRDFIEINQNILVSLHGHIHESPMISGHIMDTIGDVSCINIGQSYKELDYLLLTIN
jgi:uncharacterized protein